jgi:branched-chain amino acid transport system substrate-binding protein
MTIDRRTALRVAAGLAAGVLPFPMKLAVAQGKPNLVLGASLPLSGFFAAAAAAVNSGMQDYIALINEQGGVAGRKVRYEAEDTAYKVDVSVSSFNKITAEDKVNLYYADSTGFAKVIAPDVTRKGNILMGGNSFATELNDPTKFPFYFMSGPDYSEMVKVLLLHIAKETPKARIALVHSDTEFGRDPIGSSLSYSKELGLNIVQQIATPPTSVDVSTEVLKLRRADPDYTIFHGYTLAPMPEFITQAKGLGMKSRFMGTYWAMDLSTVEKMGADADGFMGVVPYRYYFDREGRAPMLDRIRKMRPEYQQLGYIQGFLTAMLLIESAKRASDAGKELTGTNLKEALNSIKDFDTGGLIGVPITVKGNSIPVGRVYRYDAKRNTMLGVSDWIDLSK